jgi:hypothetical protein
MKTLQQRNMILKNQLNNTKRTITLSVTNFKTLKTLEREETSYMPLNTINTFSALPSKVKLYKTQAFTNSPEQSAFNRLKTFSVASKASRKGDIFVTEFNLLTLPDEGPKKLSCSNLATMPLSNFKGRPVNTSLHKTDVTLHEDLRVSKLRLSIPKKKLSKK